MTAPMPLRKTKGPAGSYQAAANEATRGAAAEAGYDLQKDIGSRLGALAGIGALRSGGAAQGVRDATKTFSRTVGNAASQNALQAASLDAADARQRADLGFQRESLASGERVAASDRLSRETLAGNELGFKREDLAAQNARFGEDLGFRRQQLTSSEQQSAADRASREGMAANQIASTERMSTADREQRGSQFAADLGFRQSEGIANRTQQQGQFESDLAYKNRMAEENARQFSEDLGFRRESNTSSLAEQRRQFDLQRSDALKAAEQKRKGGMFGFLGKALGFAANFIPGGNLVKTGVKVAGQALSNQKAPEELPFNG